MDLPFWAAVLWVVAACALGFAITSVFSWWLKISRNLFLIPYLVLTSVFLVVFFLVTRIDVAALLARSWIWGIVAGVVVGIFLVFNVRSQPASQQSKGGELAWDIIWPGFLYGLVDGIFLSVMPVVAIWAGASQLSWASTLLGKILVGFIALVASLFVSVSYHHGYSEFHSEKIKFTILGPGLMTLAYLVSSNPLASMISHSAMHIAAVLRGPETTVQLPPHGADGGARRRAV
jgi:hypothetical protein